MYIAWPSTTSFSVLYLNALLIWASARVHKTAQLLSIDRFRATQSFLSNTLNKFISMKIKYISKYCKKSNKSILLSKFKGIDHPMYCLVKSCLFAVTNDPNIEL